jgi:hypothetical protein
MCCSLQSGPNIEDIRKEARILLHRLRVGNVAAIERYYSVDSLAGTFEPTIAEAKYIIAREYGYDSWRKLEERVVGTSSTHD